MKLPLGRQDFRTLREDGLAYVDKTEQLCGIAAAAKYNFLARPRRFGKSLSVSAYAELYRGDRELFGGLWAHRHWDFAARESAVVVLEFAGTTLADRPLADVLHELLETQAEQLGLPLDPRGESPPGQRFAALIRAAAAASPSGRAVVLVDEYDKPIAHVLEDAPRARAHRDALKEFYGVLRPLDAHLEFVFLTGVSAFSKVSLFSDLNNVTNLALDPIAATVVGWTEAELDDTFGAALAATGVARTQLRRWYNGYRFAADATPVYNPWSVLSFLRAGQLRSFWFETGTPT